MGGMELFNWTDSSKKPCGKSSAKVKADFICLPNIVGISWHGIMRVRSIRARSVGNGPSSDKAQVELTALIYFE